MLHCTIISESACIPRQGNALALNRPVRGQVSCPSNGIVGVINSRNVYGISARIRRFVILRIGQNDGITAISIGNRRILRLFKARIYLIDILPRKRNHLRRNRPIAFQILSRQLIIACARAIQGRDFRRISTCVQFLIVRINKRYSVHTTIVQTVNNTAGCDCCFKRVIALVVNNRFRS